MHPALLRDTCSLAQCRFSHSSVRTLLSARHPSTTTRTLQSPKIPQLPPNPSTSHST